MKGRKQEPESSQEPKEALLLESSSDEDIILDEPGANELPTEKLPADEPHADEPHADEPPVQDPPAKEPHDVPEDWNTYSADYIKNHSLINNKVKYLIKWRWDCASRTEEADETYEDAMKIPLVLKQEYWKDKIKTVQNISLTKKQWCCVILHTGTTLTLQKNLIPKELIQAWKDKRKRF
jgi:hypothetical protein